MCKRYKRDLDRALSKNKALEREKRDLEEHLLVGVLPSSNSSAARQDSVDSSPELREHKRPKIESVSKKAKRQPEQGSSGGSKTTAYTISKTTFGTTTAYTLSDKDALNLKIVNKDPTDPGVLVCLLMQFHVLEKGHAIHVSPGTPHSYVHGLAVEIMTTSDNVLRMGLTNKHINIDAALSIVEEKQVQVLSLETTDGVHIYKPEADFELVAIDNATYQSRETNFAGVLNLEGETKISDGAVEISLAKGEVALIINIDVKVVVKGHAVVARSF